MDALLALDADFAVGVGTAGLRRQEEISRTAGGKPAGEQLRAMARGTRGLGEQHFGPAPDMAQLGSAPAQQRQHRFLSGRSSQEMRERMIALREDVCAYAGLVVQQRAFVGIRRRGVHARPEIDEDASVAVPAFHDGGRRIGSEPRRVDQVVLMENPNRRGPLERREGLIQRATDRVVVGHQTRRLARALKEVRERVGAVVERADDPRGCGNGHEGIITHWPMSQPDRGVSMRVVSFATFTLLSVAPLRLGAQDSTRPDSAVLRPPEPTADQQQYLRGLRTVARGVAQLKSGVDGVVRAEAAKDTSRLRRAGRLLAGLCGTARTFMAQGRPGMKAVAYEDSARVKARRLVVQVDSMIKTLPACETAAGKTPKQSAAELLGRLRSYEAALQEFRVIVATPVVTPPAPQP